MANPPGFGEGDEHEQQQQQHIRRRLRRRMLPLSSGPPPPPEVTEEEGAILFNTFMHEELTREHLDAPAIPIEFSARQSQIFFASPIAEVPRAQSYSSAGNTVAFDGPSEGLHAVPGLTSQSSNFKQIGRQIRQCADEFANSPQGQQVKEKANEVDIEALNFNSFQDLLSGVFYDGQFNRTTVVAVFVFCSTLVIRSLKTALKLSPKIINWCFKYITERVCSEVQQEGGWDAVINGMVGGLFKLGLSFGIASVALAALYWVWKK